MDIELFRTFLEVNRTRHFGQAAESLHLTQAAVSARVKQLELILGIQLFDRNTRGVKLTPEGHRLKRHAERILADWRKARQEVTAGGARHQLSVSSNPRLWDIFLHKWMIELRLAEPDLALTTYSLPPESMIRQLNDGMIDLAFMLDPPQIEQLQIHELAPLRLTLVSDRDWNNPTEAIENGFIMVDWGLAHALELQRAFPDMPEPMTRLSTARLALGCLQNIGGCAYLPMVMVAGLLRRKKLFRVNSAPVFERHVHAVYPVRSDRLAIIAQALSIFRKP